MNYPIERFTILRKDPFTGVWIHDMHRVKKLGDAFMHATIIADNAADITMPWGGVAGYVADWERGVVYAVRREGG